MSIKLCRACLRAKESFTYYLMDNVRSEIYLYCTSIEIKEDEDLPRALCNMCYHLLLKFFNFKQTCIQSQKKLCNYDNNSSEDANNTILINDENTKFEVCAEGLDENSILGDEHSETKHDETNEISVKEEHLSDNISDVKQDLEHETTINQNRKIHKRVKTNVKSGAIKKTVKLRKSFENCLTCNLCGKKYYSTTSYDFHKLSHSKEISVQCPACTKTFMTRSGLRRHFQACHTRVNLDNLKCRICGKICKTKSTLNMHIKLHSERKLYVCDVCGKSCTTIYSLKAHIDTHKKNRERRFTCEHCGKKFFTNRMLITHSSRSHTDRRFICDVCNYPFTDKYNLTRHLLLHEGKRLHKCDMCDKAFGARSTLVEHMRIHSGERPYVCTYCPKSFLSKKRLREHNRIHTGEKPYKCDVCEQAFTQCGTLNRHMKVHDRNVTVLT